MKQLLLIIMLLPAVAMADSYLCVTDKATGFVKNKGEWEFSRFNIDDLKYIIRKIDADTRNKYPNMVESDTTHVVTRMGEKYPSFFCGSTETIINCYVGIGSFRFQYDTGKFISANTAAYIDDIYGDNPP